MSQNTEADLSPALAALERAWGAIRARYDVPHVVIHIARPEKVRGGYSKKLGHFGWGKGWFWDSRAAAPGGDGHVPEVLVVATALRLGAASVFEVLLHEAVHAHHWRVGIKDTSRGNAYHNKKFAKTAAAWGLVISEDKKLGYGATLAGLTPEALDDWSEVIRDIDAAIAVLPTLPDPPPPKEPKAPKDPEGSDDEGAEPEDGDADEEERTVRADCGCRVIRASRRAVEAGDLTCGRCGGTFEPVAKTDKEE